MLRRACIAAGLAALSLLLSGYQYVGADNDLWIPLVLDVADPRLYPGDPSLESPQGVLTLHVDALGALARVVDLEWLLFVLFVACRVLAFVVIGELFVALTRSEAAAVMGLALLSAPHPVGGTMAFSLSEHLIPRTFVEVLGPAALLAALRSRHAIAGGLLGLGFLLHPISALPMAAAAGTRALVARSGARALLLLGSGPAIASLFLLARLGRAAPSASTPALSDGEWMLLLRWQVPYAFLSEWDAASWRSCALWVAWLALAAAWSLASRDLLALASGPTALAVIVPLLGEHAGLPAVLSLQCARGLGIPLLLSAACAGAWAARAEEVAEQESPWRRVLPLAPTGALVVAWGLGLEALACAVTIAAALVTAWRTSGWRRVLAAAASTLLAAGLLVSWRGSVSELSPLRPEPWIALACGAGFAGALALPRQRPELTWPAGSLVISALVVSVVGSAPVAAPWMPHEGWGTELVDWAREETPIDARFCAPGVPSFRALARRTSVFEVADAGPVFFSRTYATDWLRRWQRFAEETPVQARVAELQAGAFDYLVLLAREPRPPLPVVYEDAMFRVHVRAPAAEAAN